MNDHAIFLGKIVRKLQKYIDKILTSSSPEPLFKAKFNQTWHGHPLLNRIQVSSNEGPIPFPRENTLTKF